MIRNLNQLKKSLKTGTRFQITNHCRPECVGQLREVTVSNTQGFYSILAWNCMRVDLYNYYKSNRCQKRNAEVLSIHIGISAESYPLENTVAVSDDLMKQLEAKLLLHELAGKVSEQQIEMVRLKTCGYNLREIARQQKTPMRRVKEALEEVRTVLMEMCYQH